MLENFPEDHRNFLKGCIEHGLGLVDEEDGEPFSPFVDVLTQSGQPATHVLVVDQLQEAFESATRALKQYQGEVRYYGLMWDGYVTLDNVKSDCIFIELGQSDEDQKALLIVQRYTINNDKQVSAFGEPIVGKSVENRLYAEDRMLPFSRSQWETLVGAPFIVFVMIAGADGNIDEKEKAAFIKVLQEQENIESQGLKMVLAAGLESPNVQLRRVVEAGADFDFVEQLTEARSIMAQYTQDGGAQFCSDLYSIAERVAKSSGGFLGFRSIGKSERAILTELRKVLGIDGS